MITFNWRNKLSLWIGAALVVTGLLVVFAAPGASARSGRAALVPASHPVAVGGDNGTVKIHNSTTPVTDPRNEPHVCVFYLDAFGFDAAQAVTWKIESWPPTGDRTVVSSGALPLDASGGGRTADMTLPNGHYKLFWNFAGENGFAKQKVFWVACGASPSPSGTPSPTPTSTSTMTGSPSPSASVSSTATATPTPGPSGTGSASAVAATSPVSPPSSPSQGGLPITGWPLALIALAGAALVAVGGAAMVVARRRRGLHSR